MSLSKLFYPVGIVFVFFIQFLLFFYPIPLDLLNSDLGRHLLLGKIIVTSGSVPTTNLLSYTHPDYSFVNTHWFSQVIFYLWHSAFGFNGLILLSVFLAITTLGFVFLYAARRFDVFTTILISLIFIQAIAGRTQVRPELFSFLFLAIFIVILYRYRESYTKWIFALVPLSFLWVNTHIYFFNGIVVLVLFLIDAFISQKKHYTSKNFLTLLFVTIAAGLATLCNPHFIKGALYPLFVLNDYAVPVRENISFFSPYNTLSKPSNIFFLISLLILWIGLFVSRKKMAPIDFFLSAFFTFMGLFAIRNFPLFIFGAFIPSVKAASYVREKIFKKHKEKAGAIKIVLFIIVCLAISFSLTSNTTNHQVGFGVIDNSKGAIDFFEKNKLKGPVYNNYDIGNYVEYRLYPREKVYVDNRPEAYPKEFFQKIYFPMQKSEDIFAKEKNKYHFNIIILAHTDTSSGTKQLLHRLIRDDEWKPIYLNSTTIIFIRNSPENEAIIQQYGFDQKSVEIRDEDSNDKNKVSQFINFFKAVDWPQQFLEMNLRYLEFEPTNCSALQNVIYFYKQQNNYAYKVYANTFLQHCR